MPEIKKIGIKRDQVLVFRSTINSAGKALAVIGHLGKLSGVIRTSVDLNDRDNILRVECDSSIRPSDIEDRVSRLGFNCSELPD